MPKTPQRTPQIKPQNMPQSALDPDTTPRTPEERELVRNLLAGVRKFERRGVYINHEWCRVRRAPRAGAETMTAEIGAGSMGD
jgi:hypothetical protein